ncbi:MAG: hypothetical protein HYX79_02285 [Chloroflexi bacterium]|nr:hypothetical protein [Chloroflexota bacterium]
MRKEGLEEKPDGMATGESEEKPDIKKESKVSRILRNVLLIMLMGALVAFFVMAFINRR